MSTTRLLALAALLSACGGPATTTTTTTPARTSDASERRAVPVADATGMGSSGGEAGCALDTVYFEYDSNALDASARAALADDAACLRARPSDAVTLVGGTDERGTEEYNLSLGDRRARAVRTYLESSGVEAGRMSVSSMGEEWSSGGDERAMAHDRRVEPRARGGR